MSAIRLVERPSLVAVAALLAGALPAASQSLPKEGLSPHDVARIRTVSQVAVSPDGRHVAYRLSVPRDPFVEDDGPAWSHLYVVDVETATAHRYVGGQREATALAWVPDGSGITFLDRAKSDEKKALYLIPLTGGEAVQLLAHQTSISGYALSPDGKRIAFLAPEEAPSQRVAARERGFTAEAYEEDLPFTQAWVADLDIEASPEAQARPRRLPLDGNVSELHWSPDGSALVVALAPTPLVDDRYMRRRLRIVDAATGAVLVRIDNPGKLGGVAWSPDGGHLAFVSGQTIHDPKEGRLMVASASDGAIRDVAPGFGGHFVRAGWANARTLVYLADVGVETTVGEIDVEDSSRRVLVEPGGPILTSLSLTEGRSRLAFAGETPQHPAEVFVMDGAGLPRRLTNSNPWLAAERLAPQQVVRWKARDGLEVEGVLIRPSEPAAEGHPLVVYVHGGPESHNRNGWLTSYSRPGQMAAARGMAVLYPNYRASTGRGVEFSMLDHADMAGKEFDDIVDGVDSLVETGMVDRARVGVTGGSYGGYATAWLSTYYSDRFAAGVMSVGIGNQISKVGTTDIPEEMYLVHNRMRPWDDWQFFLERSPIFWADRSRTPLLILHGTEDARVHPGQSMEVYRHLKLRGQAPVRLIFYPGEAHGNRNAAARLDFSLRALRWLEHYLTGPGGAMPSRDLDYRAPPERAVTVSGADAE